MKKLLFVLAAFLLATAAKAQTVVRFEIVDGDTVPVYTFDEVILKELKDTVAEKKYLRLVRDIKVTLPYAKLAAFRLQMMEDHLATLSTEKERKAYVKKTEKTIKAQFMDDLKKLTRTQGALLIKLIHRETGRSSFELLNKYTSSFTTIFWQGVAKLYGTDLKTTFDPVEEYQVEYIIKSLKLE